nr:hypothetical protein [uncultured Carboxylicivirga sp.]
MELRLKYSNYDSYEFETLGQKGLNSAIEIFNSYPWIEETNKLKKVKEQISYPTIKLIKDNKEYVEINGFEKDGLILYNITLRYKSVIWRSLIALRFNTNEIIDFIRDFYNKKTKHVIGQLKTKRFIEGSFFIDLFSYNSGDKDKIVVIDKDQSRYYEYKFKLSKAISKFWFSSIFLLMPIGFFIYSYTINKPMDLGTFLFISLMLGAFGIPGLILTINHTNHSKNQKLYFQKNNNKFVVIDNGDKNIYDKDSVELLEKYTVNASSRAPWSFFEFWEIKFKNGETLNISDMVIGEMDFMKHTGILILKKDKKKVFLPMIKTTTANTLQ